MKKVVLAAAFAAFGGAASADVLWGVGVAGETAYSVENETLMLEMGPTYSIASVGLSATFEGEVSDSELQFNGTSFEATYPVLGVEAFGEVSLDNDWDHVDTVVGVRFQF